MPSLSRVGDYVFFESSASGPFSIRRIEELNKTATGNVEARVMCFYRRAEIPSSLVPIADKHHWGEADMEQVCLGLVEIFDRFDVVLPGL